LRALPRASNLEGDAFIFCGLNGRIRYMKRDVTSLLSFFVAAMKLASPIANAPCALPFDIRDAESTSTTFYVLDDSIPMVKGVPTNYVRWL
jgi:hypothetical protein